MTETPKYSVIKKHQDIELRQYGGYIQAEVRVDEKDHKRAVEKGFNILAGYIFGNNISKQKIDMTSPVKVAQSEKISMTTPVTVTGSDTYTVAFIMPEKYTLEALPIPIDHHIHFNPVPAHQMASIRFSGYFNNEQILKNTQRLSQWVEEEGLETEGDFIVAGYNPPWIPGFLARNEILIKIKG
jgi:hypothetical protein